MNSAAFSSAVTDPPVMHHPAAVVRKPFLLEKQPDIEAMWSEGGDDGEQAAAANGTLTEWRAGLKLR